MTQPLEAGVVGLQVLLGLTLVEAVRRRDVSAAVNALVALLAALLPFGIELAANVGATPSVRIGSALPFWIAAAGLIHAIGMLGRYETTWWWDHLAHGVSAALLAALVYAGLLVLSTGPGASPTANWVVRTASVVFVMVAGIAWEVFELAARAVADRYGIEPVLVHYGRRDTALDLVFDFVGAVLVVAVDLQVFVPLAAFDPRVTETLLTWALGLVVGGTVLLGVVIAVAASRDALSG